MTTNDEIMKCLNEMKSQANANNNALRKDVNDKLKILTEKVDNAKEEALEKESRNDIKMAGNS